MGGHPTPPPPRGAFLGEAGLGMESAEVFYILVQNSIDILNPSMMLRPLDEELKTPTTNSTELTLRTSKPRESDEKISHEIFHPPNLSHNWGEQFHHQCPHDELPDLSR